MAKSIQNTSLHKLQKLNTVPLSKELRSKHKIRNLPVRRDDTVRITKGHFKGTEGRVTKVLLKQNRLEIDGVTREKADGSKIYYPIHVSNVVLTRLVKMDERRKIIRRKQLGAQITAGREPIEEFEFEEEEEE